MFTAMATMACGYSIILLVILRYPSLREDPQNLPRGCYCTLRVFRRDFRTLEQTFPGNRYRSKSMDQPGKVTNPARGPLNRENEIFPCTRSRLRIWFSRDGFGSPVPRQPAHLHTQAEYDAYSRDSSRVPRRHPLIYFKTAIRHRVSPEFIGSRNCVPMGFTAESPPAQGR